MIVRSFAATNCKRRFAFGPKGAVLLASACLAMLLAGCATITRGTTDTLVVESEPAGANVRLSNGFTGKTPTSFKLSRKEAVTVEITKDGYEPISVQVSSQVSGKGSAGMAGNVIFGGLVGVVVDPLSGAMKDLTPNPVQVRLVRLAADAPRPPEKPTLKAKLEELDVAFKAGLLTELEYKAKKQAVLDSM